MESTRSLRPSAPWRRSLAIGALPVGAFLLTLLFAQAAFSQEATEMADRMIAAHGGMATWKDAPTISFTDEFRFGTATEGMPSQVTVEQGRRRAYIDYDGISDGLKMHLFWDGEKCWTENWQMPTPPRFLALLNYYFLNLPWLVKDKGVVLGEPGREKLPNDSTEYISMRMGFESNVGDTPDDYYVLLIDPETYRLHGCKYIVTYKDALPEGVASSPEHLLIYDELVDVDGLKLPSHYTIYDLDNNVYATCAVRDWSLEMPFDKSRMTMSDTAVIDQSKPR
jgi:hypothetical protein